MQRQHFEMQGVATFYLFCKKLPKEAVSVDAKTILLTNRFPSAMKAKISRML